MLSVLIPISSSVKADVVNLKGIHFHPESRLRDTSSTLCLLSGVLKTEVADLKYSRFHSLHSVQFGSMMPHSQKSGRCFHVYRDKAFRDMPLSGTMKAPSVNRAPLS